MSKEFTPRSNTEELTDHAKVLANKLFDIEAIKFGEFKLKFHEQHPDAPKSPIYINLRLIRRFPQTKYLALDIYEGLISTLEFDLLADVPTAATPIVSSLSDRLRVGMISPRSEKKSYGTEGQIDGHREIDKGAKVLVVDDVLTRANSKITAISTLRENGYTVSNAVVLLDRGHGGAKELEKIGVKIHSAISLDSLIDHYLESGKIDQNTFSKVKSKLEELNQFFSVV